MNKFKVAALVCAVWVAFLPSLCLAQAASQGNDGSPQQSGGVRVLGGDGVSDRKILTDANGRLDVLSGYPVMDILSQTSNRTLATAAVDSTLVPFTTAGYRQIYFFLRLKAATFGATCHVELAARGHFSAQFDSTAAGWWYTLGKGLEHGKTIQLLNPPSATNGAYADRFWMIPVTDSLTYTPLQAPYVSFWLRNLTGAQLIFDLWAVGVR